MTPRNHQTEAYRRDLLRHLEQSEALRAQLLRQAPMRAPIEMPLAERIEFFSIPEPNSGCWLWTQAVNEDGYGYLRIGQQAHKAHRASWMAFRGPVPDGLHVCHKCDVPSCVNPAHLFLGTHQENMADMCRKGRRFPFRGENGTKAKLTEAQVREIRNDPRPNTILAIAYGVVKGSIWAIKARRNWKHLP